MIIEAILIKHALIAEPVASDIGFIGYIGNYHVCEDSKFAKCMICREKVSRGGTPQQTSTGW